MSYVTAPRDPDYNPSAPTSNRRHVDVVYVKESTRPKWMNPAGDSADPNTWTDAAGYWNWEVVGPRPNDLHSIGFGHEPLSPGDRVLNAHAHLSLDALNADSFHPNVRGLRLIGEGQRPVGGVLNFAIERRYPKPLPSESRKREAALQALAREGNQFAIEDLAAMGKAVQQPPPAIPKPDRAAADALRSAGSALSQLANALQPQAA